MASDSAQSQKRIIVADKTSLYGDALSIALTSTGRFTVVATAVSGQVALELYRALSPDLALLDWFLPALNGYETARAILAGSPRARLIIMDDRASSRSALLALQLGVKGYIDKGEGFSALCAGILAAAQDRLYASATGTSVALTNDATTQAKLTRREAQVVQLIAEGLSAKHIAIRLGVSTKTIRKHRDNVGIKFDVHNLQSLTRLAIREGLILP